MVEKKFETPFTGEEKEKQLLHKKLSHSELISQKIPFMAAPHIEEYFKLIQSKSLRAFESAESAKKKGFDLSDSVEITPAVDLADRAETIIGLAGLAKRFREIFAETNDRRKAYFQLFKEILDEKWWKFPSDQQRVEIGIKTCLLIETEGVVVAPLDGVPKVEINSNPDGSKYIDIYFAGPIRAAGGSSTVIPLILGDYARNYLKLGTYKPTEDEVERYVEEIGVYQTEVVSRQYTMSDEEIRIIIRGCPVCINGVPTEEVEVSAHRDLARIPTNRIRGGMGLVVTEGLALKALWVMKTAKDLGLESNWSFLEKIVKVEKTQTKIEVKPNKAFLERLAAGRPIIAYPSTWGGFRLRYGRGRNTGIMAKAINPATMILLDEFIAVGTHGRIERPGKATQFFPCSSIDGPIVLLKNGSVMRINSIEDAESIKASVEKILYVGDLLATFGDFKKSAHPLVPVGYCEEWWQLELKKACEDNEKLKKLSELKMEYLLKARIPELKKVFENVALVLSKELGVPLHPNFLHFYRALNLKEIIALREYLMSGKIVKENNGEVIIIAHKPEEKKFLEKIGLPHKILGNEIRIEDFATSIAETFGLNSKKSSSKENLFEYLSEISGITIKDKAGSFIGGRMGRPEQAKPRQMKGNPHVLFPIGLKGGSTKSINKAIDSNYNESGKTVVEIAEYVCPQCKKISINRACNLCKIRGVRLNYCKHCQKSVTGENCGICGNKTSSAGEHEINLALLMDNAKHRISENILSDPIKGVRGMIAEIKEAEPLEKGILRAKHDVHIFRDGTSRFELLNAAITHFKPKELNLGVEKIKELGYKTDVAGNEITSDSQMIELFPQDIIVHESCGDWLVKVSKFIDDLLEKFYKEPRFYNALKKEDLIGELVLGLAPHTSAAVNARILGYTKARLGFGHPYFVCAKRRNCLPADELVLVERNNIVEQIPIGKISAIQELNSINGINTFSIDSNGKVKKRRILEVISRPSPKTLIEIITKAKRTISLTSDHKMMILENGKLITKKACLLKKNDALLALIDILPNKINKKIQQHNTKHTFGDFVIDKIVSLKEIPKKSKYVYDLVVEGEKNYVAGTGQLAVYDCDGDQDSVMLLMDGLLNFSHKFLSHKSGGRMDAPLVFTIVINPSEVDDEVHKMETCWNFPLELYEKSQNVCEPNITIETVKDRLGMETQYSGIGFTHDTELFDEGPKTSRYIQLKTMDEKIQRQNNLQKKIMAVNAKDALERVMGSHFLPDIIGNARSFSRQSFRCTTCNEKYRRIPLIGKCYKCGKSTIILTIHEGSVRKYLKIAQNMARQENLSPYLIQRLNMIEKEINSVFKSDTVQQKSLFEFA